MNYFLVFLGGGLGSITRFMFSKILAPYPSVFPIATFFSNTLSSLILGLLFGYFAQKQISNDNLRLLIATGFCGGFSTFSTFSYETFMLVSSGNFKIGLLNILANLLICYGAVVVGFFISRSLA